MKCTISLNRINHFCEFEQCWKHLGIEMYNHTTKHSKALTLLHLNVDMLHIMSLTQPLCSQDCVGVEQNGLTLLSLL